VDAELQALREMYAVRRGEWAGLRAQAGEGAALLKDMKLALFKLKVRVLRVCRIVV